MINELVVDLLAETRARIAAAAPASADGVRAAGPLASFSPAMSARSAQLKRFLTARLYRHERVTAVMRAAKEAVRRLFDAFAAEPALLPEEHRERVERLGGRAIADYIAGMTDRFALKELARLGRADDLDATLSPRRI
jgi:dGTPase